MANQKANIPNS